MRKKDIIVRIIGSKIGPYGFEYAGYVSNRWSFVRIVNEVTQNIVIAKDLYSDGVRVEINTSEQSCPLEIRDLTYDPQYQSKDYWEYHNDEEFIQVIEELGNLIVQYGIDKFDEISQPKVSHIPSEELELKLYNKQAELENNYLSRYQIESKDNQTILKHVVEDMDKLVGQKYEDILDELLELAAVIGNLFIRGLGGYWFFSEEERRCCLNETSIFNGYLILVKTVRFWEGGGGREFLKEYTGLINFYNKNR